ncbi:hypothetical protein [Microseira sp. BLCC-F43]|uniref:hypothetical protein n=1 Tax=Microseira sp. BLCC-F43 TaxID=3153602 RepID=UPI0035B6B009
MSGRLWFLSDCNDYFRCGNTRDVNNVEVQAQLLSELGWAYMEGEDFVHAQQYFQESLQKYQLLK